MFEHVIITAFTMSWRIKQLLKSFGLYSIFRNECDYNSLKHCVLVFPFANYPHNAFCFVLSLRLILSIVHRFSPFFFGEIHNFIFAFFVLFSILLLITIVMLKRSRVNFFLNIICWHLQRSFKENNNKCLLCWWISRCFVSLKGKEELNARCRN